MSSCVCVDQCMCSHVFPILYKEVENNCASEWTERSNLVVSMGLELFFFVAGAAHTVCF